MSTSLPVAPGLVVEPVTQAVARPEARRLAALATYTVVDSQRERTFDDLTQLAARVCGTPMALVSLVDRERQWFKARFGVNTAETPRQGSFCAHTILEPAVLEVNDADQDPRFAANQFVRLEGVRFYAGAPLLDGEGNALGALCVMDRKPRTLTPEQREALEILARQTVALLELRRSAGALDEEGRARKRVEEDLRAQNQTLQETQKEASRLLALAEASRGSLLSVLEGEQRTTRALERSNRALKMLSRCSEALIWAVDEIALLKQICRIAVELGGHRMAFVGYAQDDAVRSILPMAQWGDDQGYLAAVHLTWAEDDPMGQGPAGRCIREGIAMLCGDVRDPAWKFRTLDEAESRGYRSALCLPLSDKERTFGLLGLYSGDIGDLAADEVRLLQQLADDLAYGIGGIRGRLVKERAEAALVSSLREKEALLKEVHHRVKNNLQVIASLLRLESRRIDHDITKSVLEQMQSRIRSMALLHETLYQSGDFARLDLATYLRQLALQLLRSVAAQPSVVRLELDLASIPVEIDQAIPCGLIVNELASNSLKHAFPDGRSGEVRIQLRSTNTGGVILTVSDDGIGLPQDFDSRKSRSLGLQLVSDLARQLQGAFTIGPGPSASFEVSFPNGRRPTAELPRVTEIPRGPFLRNRPNLE